MGTSAGRKYQHPLIVDLQWAKSKSKQTKQNPTLFKVDKFTPNYHLVLNYHRQGPHWPSLKGSPLAVKPREIRHCSSNPDKHPVGRHRQALHSPSIQTSKMSEGLSHVFRRNDPARLGARLNTSLPNHKSAVNHRFDSPF